MSTGPDGGRAGAAVPLMITAALAAVVALAAWAPPPLRRVERPYEEAAYDLALRATPAGAAPWTEHPPLTYWLLRGWSRLAGTGDLPRLRVPDLALFGLSFLTACAALTAATPGGDRRASARATAVAFALAVYCSPLALGQADRLGPDPLAGCALNLLILSTLRTVTNGSVRACAAASAAGLALSWSHVYGPVLTLAVASAGLWTGRTAGPAAVTSGRASAVARWGPVAVILPVTLTLFDPGLRARWDALLGGYWAVPVVSGPSGLPFEALWMTATNLVYDLPGAERVAHWLLVAAVLAGPVLRRSPAAVLTSVALAVAASALMAVEAAASRPALISHYGGPFFLLMIYTLYANAATGPRWLLASVVAAATLVLTAPALSAGLDPGGRGDRVLRRAGEEVTALAGDGAPVVFAGSRTYVLLSRYVPDRVLARSKVYLRRKGRPDNFIGQGLVPASRRLPQADWPAFAASTPSPRLVYVQMEGSQTVFIDLTGWKVDQAFSFSHPCLNVGAISVMLLEPDRAGRAVDPPGSLPGEAPTRDALPGG